MRFVWGLVVSGCLGFGADDAFGKDKKKTKKDKDEGILMTGITAFDSVFVRVGEIDKRLAASEAHLRTGKSDLNTALELKRGTPISTGIAELQERAQGKVSLAMNNQAVPKL